jgi:hypothetical protein
MAYNSLGMGKSEESQRTLPYHFGAARQSLGGFGLTQFSLRHFSLVVPKNNFIKRAGNATS